MRGKERTYKNKNIDVLDANISVSWVGCTEIEHVSNSNAESLGCTCIGIGDALFENEMCHLANQVMLTFYKNKIKFNFSS